jgi:hypothetical protein
LRLIAPEIVLLNAGVCEPESTPVIANAPENFSVPLAWAKVPVPPVILAVPLSVTVPAPSGAFADELTTLRLRLLEPPVNTPLPVKLKPELVEVVGTAPDPLNLLAPKSVPVPVPERDVTVAEPDVELLFVISSDSVPLYEPLKATLEGDVVVVTTAFGVTLFEGLELGPVPTLLVAFTVNVYAVPFFRPVTMHVVFAVLHVLLPGFDVAR